MPPPKVLKLIESGVQVKPVLGYEGFWATDDGRIIGRRGDFRTLQINRGGYQNISVYINGKYTRPSVHKLVMLAFEGPRPEGMEVRHLDGNKLNNAYSNLKYGTKSENQFDSITHGTNHWANGDHSYANRTHCNEGHEFTEDNIYWRNEKHKNGKIYKGRRCRQCDLMRKI